MVEGISFLPKERENGVGAMLGLSPARVAELAEKIESLIRTGADPANILMSAHGYWNLTTAEFAMVCFHVGEFCEFISGIKKAQKDPIDVSEESRRSTVFVGSRPGMLA